MRKLILILTLICTIAMPVFAVGGTYTTNGYFYMPAFGASGTAELAEYNVYMQIADTQIEANKDGLTLRYLKIEIDTQNEMEDIWGDTLMNDLADDTNPQLGNELDAGTYSIGFTVQTITSSAGTATINWGNSNKARITLSENTTLVFTNPANSGNYMLIIIQPAGSNAYTTTFPAGIYWSGGTKITIPTTDNNRCIVSFAFDDEDGDKWYCQGTETFATDD